MKEEYAELAICNKRLKGSEILTLNDPFELLPNIREKNIGLNLTSLSSKLLKIIYCSAFLKTQDRH